MLISIRRFLAVLLVPIFLVLFLGIMLVFRVNATVLESDFYTDALDDLDVYNFLYDVGIPFAIERAEEEGSFSLDSVPLGIELRLRWRGAHRRRVPHSPVGRKLPHARRRVNAGFAGRGLPESQQSRPGAAPGFR